MEKEEKKVENDIAEDEREENESIEKKKKLIAEKDVEIERLKKDLDEAHKVFMNEERKSEEPKRDFNNLTKSYQ